MPGSKQKYNFERALSALRATQSRVGGRVAPDPAAEVNLPLENLQSLDQGTGEERTTHEHQSALDKNGGETGGTGPTEEECPIHDGAEGEYDGISGGKKRGSEDSSTTQGHISFGNGDDDGDEFWMDSDDGQANTEKGAEMYAGKRGESLDIPKELEDTDENKLEMDGQNETIGQIICAEEDGNFNKDDGVSGNGNGESPDGDAGDAGDEIEETPREYTVVTIESTQDELVENDVCDDQEVWHDSSEGNGNGEPSPADGENGESSNGKGTFISNDGADENIEEHSSSDDHSSGGEDEESESNGDETSDSDDNDAGGDEAFNNVGHDGIAAPDIPEILSGGMDVGTQTNFRQGFLKSFRKEDSGERKRRRNSEPLDMRGAGVDKKGHIFWDRVYDWTQRRRSKRPSLRGYIQGRGGGLVVPGGPIIVQQNQMAGPPTLLHAYVNCMYWLCVSTREVDQGKPMQYKCGHIAQKIGFWILAVFAIAYSFDILKFFTFEYLDDGNLHDYAQLGFLLIYGITRIYSILLHGFKNNKIKEMVNCMNNATLGTSNNKYSGIIAKILGCGSLLVAMVSSIFGDLSFTNWSWKNIVLGRAYEMSHTIFIWSATNYTYVTKKLDAYYSSEVNELSVTLAVPEIAWTFCGYLQDLVLGDLILSAAASLLSNTTGYVDSLKSKPPINISYEEFKRKWNEYQVIAEASDKFYDTCGTLLTLYHLYNLLQLAIFLRLMLTKGVAQVYFITTLINVIKSMATYIYAIRISEKNQTCRNWVRQCAFHSLSRKRRKHRKLYMQAILMLDEMKENPLGFGRDELLINKGFLITFLGMAVSLFAMMAEYTDEARKEC